MSKLKVKAPIHRSNPFGNLMNDFFEGEFRNHERVNRSAHPSANIFESEDQYAIELVVPGYEKTDFSIELKDEILTVQGKRKETESLGKLIRQEHQISTFKRVFKLSESVDVNRVNANYEQGLLRLEMKKKEIKLEDKVKVISVK